jgi:hypothetical protein
MVREGDKRSISLKGDLPRFYNNMFRDVVLSLEQVKDEGMVLHLHIEVLKTDGDTSQGKY